MDTATEYKAFLIRLKRRNGRLHWRATLENVHTGEVLHFATERDLLLYMLQTLDHSLTFLDGAQEIRDGKLRPNGEEI